MSQPVKQCRRTATVAWCATEAAPTLMAMGSSASSAAGIVGGDTAAEASLDLMSFDLAKSGQEMDMVASVRTDGGRRFSSVSWGSFGTDGSYPYGIIAGGLQEGVVSLWNPYNIVNSKGADAGLIHTTQVHQGAVHCVEFHPMKPNLIATCGSDGEVNILNVENPSQPDLYKPSNNAKTHEGSEVLKCAWNRKVPHILGSCSNKGTTVVWDLKQRKEVISFQDPANRLRCSDVVWSPDKPTQVLVAYDDDRQPSMQMWDLRNVKYPFKETAGHSKGILGVSWNVMDPNLILSCGKDNRVICWFNGSVGLEPFCEVPTSQANFEVKWSPHKPGLISAASFNGSVCLHSVQTQQSTSSKYCPAWYKRPCGVSFGFGGKMVSYGVKKAAAAVAAPGQAAPPASSFCHALVVPNEPEVVATADVFEQWRAERKFQEFCHNKTSKSGGTGSHEGLMWELMGLQFEEQGRMQVPALLGFDQERILQEAERYLGKKPGTTLMGPPPEEEQQVAQTASAAKALGPELQEAEADDFFKSLAESTEQQRAADAAAAAAAAVAAAEMASAPKAGDAKAAEWAEGPELLIKQSLLVGNLAAAVECCFKSGRMAEALLLASGGGTTLWTRARDEYLRLQGDAFLSTVGSIMTNEFEKLVGASNLSNWMETLAIIATYSGDQYPILCEQLAERLEKEKFDIRSAVICYICAKNFSKTVTIWANTHVASMGSKKLALQDLVEKMAVLQEMTKFNQADALFNAKLTQYAEILANSGRLTAAMRYLCLLSDDASSAILRDRIYNSAPMQMSQMFGRQPAFPFEHTDIRILYQAPPQQAAQPTYHQGMHGHAGMSGAPAPGYPQPGMHQQPQAPGMHQQPQAMGMHHHSGMQQQQQQQQQPQPQQQHQQQQMPPRPSMPGPGMPPAPSMQQPQMPGAYGGGGGNPGMGASAPAPMPHAPMSAPAPAPGPSMGPAPRMSMGGCMPPAQSMAGGPAPMAHGGMPPAPGGMQQPGMPAQPAGMSGMPGMAPQHQPQQQPQHGGYAGGMVGASPTGGMPVAGPGVLPPGQMGIGGSGGGVAAPAPAMAKSTAPTASAAPVMEDMPVCWPLPTKTQQRLSTTQATAAANQAIQERSAGGATIGEPMAAHELQNVKGVLGMLLEASAQDGNMKKREDINNRLEDLYVKLAAGQIKTAASQKVLSMVKSVEAQDYASANKLQMELSTMDWESNKNWLMGVRRLIPRG